MPLFPPLTVPFALYDGELGTQSNVAWTANQAILVGVTLNAPAVLTALRAQFSTGGNGHYDLGIYDATGTNGAPNNLLAHCAATATSLSTSTSVLSPTLVGGNLALLPARYWLALWVDNSTDHVVRSTGDLNMQVVQMGTLTPGPLPSTASGLTSLANIGSTKPVIIGLLSGGWS